MCGGSVPDWCVSAEPNTERSTVETSQGVWIRWAGRQRDSCPGAQQGGGSLAVHPSRVQVTHRVGRAEVTQRLQNSSSWGGNAAVEQSSCTAWEWKRAYPYLQCPPTAQCMEPWLTGVCPPPNSLVSSMPSCSGILEITACLFIH